MVQLQDRCNRNEFFQALQQLVRTVLSHEVDMTDTASYKYILNSTVLETSSQARKAVHDIA